MTSHPTALVLMGTAGSGKSTLGRRLADMFSVAFLEGDDFHPDSNVQKMAAGTPLDDGDRWPWLEALGVAVGAAAKERGLAIAACSALKRSYREHLEEAAELPVHWIYMKGSPEILRRRMSERHDHFMPLSLLDSQLATLEPPSGEARTLTIEVSQSPDEQLEIAQRWVRDVKAMR